MDTRELALLLGEWALGRGPLYRRLADALLDAVRRGDITRGTRLPSEREVARSLSVSRTTAIAAYRVLRDEGLVVSVRGSGTRIVDDLRSVGPVIPAAVMPSLKLLGSRATDVIDCSNSVLAGVEGLPDELLRVTASDVRRLARDYLYEPAGLPQLRRAIADRFNQQGLPTDPDEVLVTTGAQQAIELACGHFGGRGSSVVLEDPTYFGALDAIRAAGGTIEAVPLDGDGPFPELLSEALAGPAARLIYLMPSCHNPTGVVTSPARRELILSLAEGAATPIIDDMTLAELVHGPERSTPLAAPDERVSIITVSSLSKAFWPGLRIGWLRASKPIVERLTRLKVVADLGSSHISQLIAARVVPVLDELTKVRRAELAARLDLLSTLLAAELPEWAWQRPQGGPCLWVRLPYGHAEPFAQLALRHGVRVLPGTKMSSHGGFVDHLRVSFVAEPRALQEAVDRLARAWDVFSSSGIGQRTALDIVV